MHSVLRRLLIDEIKLYNKGKVEEGGLKQKGPLRSPA